MIYTLSAPRNMSVVYNLVKSAKMGFGAMIWATCAFFLWSYASYGFEVVNYHPDNQMKVLLWSAVAIMEWAIVLACTLVTLSLGSRMARKGAGRDVFIITFYMTAIVTICLFLGYAGTVFFTGATTFVIVAYAIANAAGFMYIGFGWCVKCWNGAKLP